MPVYKYDLSGVSPNLQFGKNGGRIVWDTDHLESQDDTGLLAPIRVATTPVNVNDVTSKSYVDSAVATGVRPTVSVFYPAQPPSSRFIMIYTFDRPITFPDNFVGSRGNVLTNPTASYVFTVTRNLVSIGTITISTSGVFTFNTAAVGIVSFATGDRLGIQAPAIIDTTLADISITLRTGT